MAAHALVETGKQQQQQQNKNPTTAINQVHNVFVLVSKWCDQVVWAPLKKAQDRTLLSPSQIMDATTTSESAVPAGGGGGEEEKILIPYLSTS